jgi:hypothetical protein
LSSEEADVSTRWWHPRRDDEPTADYLARVLDELGHTDMARRALLAHFDDYFCPPDVDDGANIHRLVAELDSWARSATRDQRHRARAVIEAAKDGEFDGTRAEADRWAASADGQAAFHELFGGRQPS